MTQWHPVFAQLLRPLVEGHYEVRTNVPVGDAPRSADILLLRRTSTTAPPFQGLWRSLTTWNVLEFKGPTVSARVADLDLLIELGLGIERRLNAEQSRQRRPAVPRGEVSFWYLANHRGRRFLADARALLGELEALAAGVWRVRLLERPLVLVSGRELAVERDSVPVHLLGREPLPNTEAVAHLLGRQPDLWDLYGEWIVSTHPAVWEELLHMARAKKPPFTVDLERLMDVVGKKEFLRKVGQLVEKVGLDEWLAQLPPQRRRAFLRQIQKKLTTEE